ncbi:hypothetical protein RF11_10382 [Thelohanellus kitauei]|uniref:Uncharacterized protein n=1 Tax=Thelohanellus kitauei TaxID=669202 RepID=A0A0C2N8L4_THEKT|nr:hypothetical protein RF11_10382 [Thelohanellus kitauei]
MKEDLEYERFRLRATALFIIVYGSVAILLILYADVDKEYILPLALILPHILVDIFLVIQWRTSENPQDNLKYFQDLPYLQPIRLLQQTLTNSLQITQHKL